MKQQMPHCLDSNPRPIPPGLRGLATYVLNIRHMSNDLSQSDYFYRAPVLNIAYI